MKKKLLITGGAGFIGQNFLKRSKVLDDFEITAFYNSKIPKIKLDKKINFFKVDLLCAESKKKLFENYDIIFHCAGVMMTSSAIKNNPLKGISDNLQIHINILNLIKDSPPEKFIWLSSTTGYPNSLDNLKEEEYFSNQVPKRYEITGTLYRLMELVVNKTLKKKCNIVTLRPTGVYGERDDFRPETSHILPKIIRDSFLGLHPKTIYAEKKEKRNWIYVGDLIKALDLIIRNFDSSISLNIGSNESTSMYELYLAILKEFKLEKEIILDNKNNFNEQPMARNIDCSLSKKYLGEYNSTSLQVGLIKTIDWYKENVVK